MICAFASEQQLVSRLRRQLSMKSRPSAAARAPAGRGRGARLRAEAGTPARGGPAAAPRPTDGGPRRAWRTKSLERITLGK